MSMSTTTISSRVKFKFVFLGDQNTGKTSIIERYCKGIFSESPDPTVGVDFLGKNITHDSKLYRLQLWDTAGQERFRSLVPNYLKDASCAVFVFDLANYQSLQQMKGWMDMWQDHKPKSSVAILCGNKKDLVEGDFDVSKIEDILARHPMPYMQVSASTGENIEQLFVKSLEQCIKSGPKQSSNGADAGRELPVTEKPIRLPELLSTAVFQGGNHPAQPLKRSCC